jgi:endo-1,4-beta-xylanase
MLLWNGAAPGVPDNAAAEITGPDNLTKNVTVPTLTAFLPEKSQANGTAIILCSGGGYAQLNLKKYADLGTGAFLPRGIAVFNLKYRLSPPSKNVRADALADIERAMRLVRSRAAEWNIDPNRIGVGGASAGANLILNLMTQADAGQPDAVDLIERQSSRPNFALLLSSSAHDQKIDDFRFSPAAPIFLLHAEDDQTAKVEFARSIETEAKKSGVPIYAKYSPTGGHDSFASLQGPHSSWITPFLQWLETQKLLAPSPR